MNHEENLSSFHEGLQKSEITLANYEDSENLNLNKVYKRFFLDQNCCR